MQVDLVAQPLVVLDVLAAGRGDLHEHRLARRDRAVVEQLGERLEAHVDALGVVEPVDTEQQPRRVAERRRGSRRARVLHLGACARCASYSRVSIEMGNAPTRHAAHAARAVDGTVTPVVVGLAGRAAGGQREEVLRAAGRCGSRRGRRRAGPRGSRGATAAAANSSTGRERDVQEEADAQVGPALAQHARAPAAAGSRAPTPSRRARRPRRSRRRSARLTRDVGVPRVPVVGRRRDRVVVERPDRRVAEALVEALDVGAW